MSTASVPAIGSVPGSERGGGGASVIGPPGGVRHTRPPGQPRTRLTVPESWVRVGTTRVNPKDDQPILQSAGRASSHQIPARYEIFL